MSQVKQSTPSPNPQKADKEFISASRQWLKDLFNLRDKDKAHERDTKEEIRKGIIFRGANLWILIFAILVCSVGLNVNSTAVIIGAMLISPIMGPIMGIGLGMGINDFQLIVKAAKNLGIALLMSIVASALYFWISPLDEAQSELLARTAPNFWDVLIAFFGGTAGIVAGSRKEKSNAVPGVAIATALMPPLCTAGYGLAQLNWDFFFGALYLFFINCVFISLSTYMIVRLLRYRKKVFEKPERETRVEAFIREVIPAGSKVISKNMKYDRSGASLDLTLYGNRLEEGELNIITNQFHQRVGQEVKLNIDQGEDFVGEDDIASLKAYVDDYRLSANKAMTKKDSIIYNLQGELRRMKSNQFDVDSYADEAKAVFSGLSEFSISDNVFKSLTEEGKMDTIVLAYARFKKRLSTDDREKLENWIKVKTDSENVKLIVERD